MVAEATWQSVVSRQRACQGRRVFPFRELIDSNHDDNRSHGQQCPYRRGIRAKASIGLEFSGSVGEARWFDLTDPEPHVANSFAAEALFEFAQDVDLRDLLQLIVQGRLKNAHIENALA